jgi:hypothetical protein
MRDFLSWLVVGVTGKDILFRPIYEMIVARNAQFWFLRSIGYNIFKFRINRVDLGLTTDVRRSCTYEIIMKSTVAYFQFYLYCKVNLRKAIGFMEPQQGLYI